MKLFDIKDFIQKDVIEREQSLFWDDLIDYDQEIRREIRGKRVLVIGGAGTIGSNFIKAVISYEPARLIVVDYNENGLTELVRDLRSSPGCKLPYDFRTYPIDFASFVFEKLFLKENGFDIVANFAAHKHVRSEKDIFSIEAMIDNNVLKADRLLQLLKQYPPDHFFCVFFDKAANPVNIMGASKKLMEDLVLSYASFFPVTSARFANVAFSNGSLLQGFLERIAKRQPLSAPKDVKRYFVSPEESGQLCMLACVLGRTGEILFPKMEEDSMKSFADIAEDFLASIGFKTDYCNSEEEARQKALKLKNGSDMYPVYLFESDTSGEKPYEEFFTVDEDLDYERFKSLGVIRTSIEAIKFDDQILANFKRLFSQDRVDKRDIVELFSSYISTFEHIETGKNLDQKM